MIKSPAEFKRWLWAKITERLHFDYVLTTGIKIQIRSYGDWHVYNEVFVDKEYDAAIQDTLDDSVSEGQFVVLDLGSNSVFFCSSNF